VSTYESYEVRSNVDVARLAVEAARVRRQAEVERLKIEIQVGLDRETENLKHLKLQLEDLHRKEQALQAHLDGLGHLLESQSLDSAELRCRLAQATDLLSGSLKQVQAEKLTFQSSVVQAKHGLKCSYNAEDQYQHALQAQAIQQSQERLVQAQRELAFLEAQPALSFPILLTMTVMELNGYRLASTGHEQGNAYFEKCDGTHQIMVRCAAEEANARWGLEAETVEGDSPLGEACLSLLEDFQTGLESTGLASLQLMRRVYPKPRRRPPQPAASRVAPPARERD